MLEMFIPDAILYGFIYLTNSLQISQSEKSELVHMIVDLVNFASKHNLKIIINKL